MSRRDVPLRLARITIHLMVGAVLALLIDLRSRLGRAPRWTTRVAVWWHGHLLRILAIQTRPDGAAQPGCLLVCNHVSWLDIPVIAARSPVRFVSKSEVRGWPLIGWLAAIAGTQFIARGALQIDRVGAGLSASLAAGQHLVIFPEGTTSDGTTVLEFHARLFALALEAEVPVQPVALAYRRAGATTPDPIAPFLGDDTLVAHLLRLIRHDDLVAEIRFLEPLSPLAGETRRELARRTRARITAALRIDSATTPRRKRELASGGARPSDAEAARAA
jgi:1-acyl-sn-glycerol-3-phosphate acyltransferase